MSTLPRRVLITPSIITMRSRLFPANSASDCLRFAKSRPEFCESCGATQRQLWEMFSALQSTPGPVTCRKQRPNRCIIGDAILPQTGTKLTKKRGSKFGALLWRHLTPQRKTATQVHNYSPSRIQLLKKDFGKFTSCRTFGALKLVHSEPFFGLPIPSLTFFCCLRYIATCGKILYRCTSTFSALNQGPTAFEFSLNLSAIYTKWCAHFSADFGLFAIFDRNFAKIVAPPIDENENYVVHPKEQSILKKNGENLIKIDP